MSKPKECLSCEDKTPSNDEASMPSGVTSIRDYAFENCEDITRIRIPDGVTSIGEFAFIGCKNLKSVEIPDSVTYIGGLAFSNCASLESIKVDSGNQTYYSEGNCLVERKSRIVVAGCRNSVIPQGVTSIGECAFCCCESLTSINIPDSVTSIGESAFKGCKNLKNIAIPGSVTFIGRHAFDLEDQEVSDTRQ